MLHLHKKRGIPLLKKKGEALCKQAQSDYQGILLNTLKWKGEVTYVILHVRKKKKENICVSICAKEIQKG